MFYLFQYEFIWGCGDDFPEAVVSIKETHFSSALRHG